MDPKHFLPLLEQVRDGDRAALGHLLEEFRPYLLLLASRQFDPRLQSRVDPMDLVQISFLEAHRDIGCFQGKSFGEFASWLRTLLHRNVLQARERHLDAQRRSVRREQHAGSQSTHAEMLRGFAAEQSSPSRRAMRGEDAVLLASAIDQLPEDQAEAIRLRHLEGWSLSRLASALNRSETAVAGLIKRGLCGLRTMMIAEADGTLQFKRPT